MKINSNLKTHNSKLVVGILCAIGAAVCYGTNPLGALNLYAEGMNTPSVLFYRFGLAWMIIAAVMLFRCLLRRENLRVSWPEFRTVTALGLLFIGSSLTLYLSFHHMPVRMSSFKINFFVLFYCAAGMALFALLSGQPLMLPPSPRAWLWVGWLALVPAIMALVMMVYAAKYLGSTPTAILGALEPTTAVLIGVLVFGEPFGPRLLVGIVLILAAVTIIVLGKSRSAAPKK